jgi:hypothetical protein
LPDDQSFFGLRSNLLNVSVGSRDSVERELAAAKKAHEDARRSYNELVELYTVSFAVTLLSASFRLM